MANQWPTVPRDIVEEPRYSEERDELAEGVIRWDNAMKGVTFAIAQRPTVVGRETVVEDMYAVATEPWPDAPDVVIYYTYDDENVYLESVIEPIP